MDMQESENSHDYFEEMKMNEEEIQYQFKS